MTVPEIAERYGRPVRTVEWWRLRYDWPEPTGTRRGTGRPLEYDPAEADAAVRAILALERKDPDADPDELLTAEQAAAEAGLAYSTVRARISRSQANPRAWPPPDEAGDGAKRWRRRTVREFRASLRPDKRRRADG